MTVTVNLTAADGATHTVSLASPTVSVPGGGGGSYDNTAHWPSLNNRPVYNATTGVLTWIGPVSGGPSTTTDQQQTRTLTSSGPITTTAAGQVIQGLAIHDSGASAAVGIQVNHNNVTIKQCYVKGHPSGLANIQVNTGVTGTVIEDCELNGAGSTASSGSFNVVGNGIHTGTTVRRCHMHDYEQMVARYMQNVTIVDNYMHDTQGSDADMIEIYCDIGDSFGITIQHNTFYEPANSSGVSGWDSAINMTNEVSPHSVKNISIINNRFLGINPPHCIMADASKGNQPITGLVLTNNAFLVGNSSAGTGIWLPYDDAGSVSVLSNSGNFVIANSNDTTITGTPWNGNGVLVANQQIG